jgi:hypothetical protein
MDEFGGRTRVERAMTRPSFCRQEASSTRRLQDPGEESEGAPTTRLLPQNQTELIPSVTERTTELLLAEKKRSAKEIKRDSESQTDCNNR